MRLPAKSGFRTTEFWLSLVSLLVLLSVALGSGDSLFACIRQTSAMLAASAIVWAYARTRKDIKCAEIHAVVLEDCDEDEEAETREDDEGDFWQKN